MKKKILVALALGGLMAPQLMARSVAPPCPDDDGWGGGGWRRSCWNRTNIVSSSKQLVMAARKLARVARMRGDRDVAMCARMVARQARRLCERADRGAPCRRLQRPMRRLRMLFDDLCEKWEHRSHTTCRKMNRAFRDVRVCFRSTKRQVRSSLGWGGGWGGGRWGGGRWGGWGWNRGRWNNWRFSA